MSITWKELQETCLRKMDSLDGAALAKDSNNAAYLYGMPAAANEALMLLATNGRYWKKLLTITQGEGETATKGEPLGGFLADAADAGQRGQIPHDDGLLKPGHRISGQHA